MALQHSLLPVPLDSTETLPPLPAADLTSADVRRIQDALDHSVSANTRLSYASAWRSFEDWTRARGVPPLPAPPELVAAYLLELAEERQLSVATIRLYKAALAAMHRAAGHDDPNGLVRQVMHGTCYRCDDQELKVDTRETYTCSLMP